MPIPGSVLNGLNFDPASLGAIAFPSLATFLGITKTVATDGQETHTFAAIDSAHSNIPCRLSPLISVRPQQQESQQGVVQQSEAKLQAHLSKYVADIVNDWQLQVDGTVYEIVGSEPDGQKLTSRVNLGKPVTFNA